MKILLALLLVATLCQCRLDLSNYQLVFNQDFTVIKNLSVSSRGPLGNPPVGSQAWWMSHCNFYTDYNYFLDPQGDLQPFSLANNKLTIRTQSKTINGKSQLTSGLLNSHDDSDRGFSNKWGYFEAKAWLPQGPATWPAFWMLDAGYYPNNTRKGGYGLEIDILEQYGTPTLYTTLHYWDNKDSSKSAGKGFYSTHCDMMSGYHTYGFDYQPDYLTFYYDRVQTFRVANDFSIMGTGLTGKWDRNMTVLVNNGYNTGASQADLAVLASRPADMKVEYVRVWSGTGASNGVNNYPEITSKTWGWDEYTLTPANPFYINGASLQMTSKGNIVVLSNSNSILWQSGTSADCSVATNCRVTYQGDGNWVAYSASGAFWGSSTYGINSIGLTFQNTAPYLSMVNGSCATVWRASNTVAQNTPATYVVPPVCTVTPTSQYNGGRSFVVFPNAGLTINTTTPFLIDGVTLQITTGGDVQVIRRVDQTVLWRTVTSGNCATAACSFVFQNDGNLVLYGSSGWASGTYNQFNSVLMFQNTAPYLRIMNSSCAVIWSSS